MTNKVDVQMFAHAVVVSLEGVSPAAHVDSLMFRLDHQMFEVLGMLASEAMANKRGYQTERVMAQTLRPGDVLAGMKIHKVKPFGYRGTQTLVTLISGGMFFLPRIQMIDIERPIS